MAAALDRCRPGRVQELLGKTKLLYFGSERIIEPRGRELTSSETAVYERVWDVAFSFPTTVRTALPMKPSRDSAGREYVDVMLFRRPRTGPTELTIGEAYQFEGHVYLYTDGTSTNKEPERPVTEPSTAKAGGCLVTILAVLGVLLVIAFVAVFVFGRAR